MKFTIDSKALCSILSQVIRAVPAKPAQPIYTAVLIETKKDMLRLTATDGEIALRAVAKPDSVDREGSAALPARLLLEMVTNLPDGPVSIDAEGAHAKILWATGQSEFPVMNDSDLITAAKPDKAEQKTFTIDSDTLSTLIDKTLFCIAPESSQNPILKGILLDLRTDGLKAVATDLKTMVIYSVDSPVSAEPSQLVLTARSAGVLKALLGKEQAAVVAYDKRNIRVAFGNIEMTSRLQEGNYPNYESIIPKGGSSKATVDTQLLMNAYERMKVLGDKSKSIVKTTFQEGAVRLDAEDGMNHMGGNETVPCAFCGEEIAVGLKSTSMLDVLGHIDSQSISLGIESPNRPLVITPVPEENVKEPYTIIAMPYRF